MINELNEQQEKMLDEYANYCISRGLACDKIDKQRTEKAITEIYALAGLQKPKFHYVKSPMAALRYIAKEKGHAKLKWYECYWGQHEYGWISFARYFTKAQIITLEESEEKELQCWEDLAESCGWWWPFEKVVVISEKPSEIHLDSDNNLHRDGGAAISYSDGWCLWFLHGRAVPQWLAETEASKLDASVLGTIDNAEIRAQFIRKYGILRLENKGTLLDTKEEYDYKLIDMRNVLGLTRPAPYLFMTNPSTGGRHAEGVSAECKTVQQAINWRAGDITVNWMPVYLS